MGRSGEAWSCPHLCQTLEKGPQCLGIGCTPRSWIYQRYSCWLKKSRRPSCSTCVQRLWPSPFNALIWLCWRSLRPATSLNYCSSMTAPYIPASWRSRTPAAPFLASSAQRAQGSMVGGCRSGVFFETSKISHSEKRRQPVGQMLACKLCRC